MTPIEVGHMVEVIATGQRDRVRAIVLSGDYSAYWLDFHGREPFQREDLNLLENIPRRIVY